jgi:hypoxanthine phosphoribosyltransferase
MISLSFSEISDRLHNTLFPDVDLIVGIGTGGVVDSSLIAHQLSRPLHILKVNFRDDDNKTKYDSPVLLSDISAIKAENIIGR